MIKITANGRQIECNSSEEAVAILKHLDAEDRKSGVHQNKPTPFAALTEIFGLSETKHWTGETFWKFIESIGDQQRAILSLLVQKRKASDAELRNLLKLANNQELAGILSGISKRAGAQNIPARAVFIIENESKDGEMAKTYVAAMNFLRIAAEMNWPG